MPAQPEPQQSRQSQPQPPRTSPRIVSFVVDKELVVDARVLREHSDGSLDLEGKFGQPHKRWEDKETQNEVTGEKQIFAEEVSQPDPRVSVRSRVRRADEGEVRVNKLTPGTYFEKSEREEA